MLRRIIGLCFIVAALWATPGVAFAQLPDGRYLYVVCPGIRNYLEFGGAGVLVFDIDHGHKLVKRIATPASGEEKPDNIKGVCAPTPRPETCACAWSLSQ